MVSGNPEDSARSNFDEYEDHPSTRQFLQQMQENARADRNQLGDIVEVEEQDSDGSQGEDHRYKSPGKASRERRRRRKDKRQEEENDDQQSDQIVDQNDPYFVPGDANVENAQVDGEDELRGVPQAAALDEQDEQRKERKRKKRSRKDKPDTEFGNIDIVTEEKNEKSSSGEGRRKRRKRQ